MGILLFQGGRDKAVKTAPASQIAQNGIVCVLTNNQGIIPDIRIEIAPEREIRVIHQTGTTEHVDVDARETARYPSPSQRTASALNDGLLPLLGGLFEQTPEMSLQEIVA